MKIQTEANVKSKDLILQISIIEAEVRRGKSDFLILNIYF